MDGERLAQTLEDQRKWLRTAKAQAGHKRTSTFTRLELLWDFSNQPRPDFGKYLIRTTIVGEAYLPCQLRLTDLKKILLKDLKLETHHRGCFILVRAFGKPFKMSSTMNAVEDETGDVDRMAVYDNNENLRPVDILPQGCVLVIKEPYYKMSADRKCILRVDHVSDMIILEQNHDLYPNAWKTGDGGTGKTAVSWKLDGNAALAKKSYLEAHRCYTRGLDCARLQEPDLKRDIFRNRSLINLLLGRYDAAKEDAMFSLSDNKDEKSRTQDAKALYRSGRAAYQLEDYNDALSHFERMLALSPSDEDGLKELQRTKARLKEMQDGSYDFATILKHISNSNFYADRASFISKTEVRQTAGRGRGLFAAQDIPMGGLILCEKAFMVAHQDKDCVSTSFMINLNSNRGSKGTGASVWVRTVQKLMDNPSLGERVLHLYAGNPPTDDVRVRINDGKAMVDTFQIQQVIEYNAFGYRVGRESEAYGNTAQMVDDTQNSAGLWSRASYANHACLPNAMRSFIGHLMILRGTKAIPRGTEITIPYRNTDPDQSKYQKQLQDTWGFRCSCSLCEIEDITNEARHALIKASNDFLEKHPLKIDSMPMPHEMEKAEKLAKGLENSHSLNLSRQMPCLDMAPICEWLCQAYVMLRRKPGQVKLGVKKVLQCYGYRIDVQNSGVKVDGTNGLPTIGVVDALMRLVVIMVCEEKPHSLCAELERLAKIMYEIINGTLVGFEDRY